MKSTLYRTVVMAFIGLSMVLATPMPSPMNYGEGSFSGHYHSDIAQSSPELNVMMNRPRQLIITTGSTAPQKLASLMSGADDNIHRVHVIPTDVRDVGRALEDHHDMIQDSSLTDDQKEKFLYYDNQAGPHEQDHESSFVSKIGRVPSVLPLDCLKAGLHPSLPAHIYVMSKPHQGLLKHIFLSTQNKGVIPDLLLHRLDSALGPMENINSVEYAKKVARLARFHGTKELIWTDNNSSWNNMNQHITVPMSLISNDVDGFHSRAALETNDSFERMVCEIEDFIFSHGLNGGMKVWTVVPGHDTRERTKYLFETRSQPSERTSYDKGHLWQWAQEREPILRMAAGGLFYNVSTPQDRSIARHLHHLLTHDVLNVVNQSGPHVLFDDIADVAALHHAIQNNPHNDPKAGAHLRGVSFARGHDGQMKIRPDDTSPHKMIFGARLHDATDHYTAKMEPVRHLALAAAAARAAAAGHDPSH